MAALDSPGVFPESPGDEGDAVYPCKGCGEILEEGKAFELAGNRWHIDCFRCNTCGTLLDSDANLLLLGDGSLICNNCTYSCNACGNKIEDLAILTGDQAFCAACFRCRNCKRKIENLRYARTSQGIFCMSCHESLMARRRKKAKASKQAAAAAAAAGNNPNAPIVLDKSLPALPPTAVPQSALETPDVDASSERITQSLLAAQHIPSSQKRELSPIRDDAGKENMTLPSSIYRAEQRKTSISSADDGDPDSSGFLPMAFDPSPASGLPPQADRRSRIDSADKPREVSNSRDYFNRPVAKSSSRNLLQGHQTARSRDATPEREAASGAQKPSSPHIASQSRDRPGFKRRDTSGATTPVSGSAAASPSIGIIADKFPERPGPPQQINTGSFSLGTGEGFRLQDAPRPRKNSIRRDRTPERSEGKRFDQKDFNHMSPGATSIGTPDSSGINPFEDPKLRDPTAVVKPPARGDSLNASTTTRKPVPQSQDRIDEVTPLSVRSSTHGRTPSSVSIPSSFVDAQSYQSRTNGRPLDSPARSNMDVPPPKAAARSAPSKSVNNDDFIAPRPPPPPPPVISHDHRRNQSITSFDSEGPISPFRGHFKKPSLGGDFNMEDEMQRIMAGGRKDSTAGESTPSVLRRVSNAVRHGRSFSDRAIPTSAKTPSSGRLDISSPMLASNPASPLLDNDVASLRAHLRRAQQKIAELESEKVGLEDRVNRTPDMKQVNTELREKRSTMAFLDTQREMVVRELEVMTEHLAKAKDTNHSWDFATLKSDVLQDFAHSLQRLKDGLGGQIEDLLTKRNELTDEIANLIQVKDKGLQEFESLSSKNSQLVELNSQLVGNIQDVYKANRVPNGNANLLNGLGISTGVKNYDQSSELRSGSLSQLSQHDSPSIDTPEAEHAHILNTPQVVNIRKGQPKRFNWKKVGRDVAKNTTKGFKGAFNREENGMPISGPVPLAPGSSGENNSLKGNQYGFFGGDKKNPNLKPGQMGAFKNGSSSNLGMPSANEPSTLFGSDLVARCEFERRIVPALVTRCVEEVEARGLDVEGVYRKSGGSGQVKQIQSGFETVGGEYDISDDDLDIHAVTSCLKQYFRKLPNPLITFDVYDSVLEAAGLQDTEKRGFSLKAAIGNLPERHKDVLEFLIGHLARVVEQDAENLMTPLNISVVFAPTIMRPMSIEREMTDMQAQRDVVRSLLEHRHIVFD